ncbi:MAG: Hint domain-containing protein [Gemmobacter sp.]|nr:Hint domain-containing protein [Gemmobacter sp.]
MSDPSVPASGAAAHLARVFAAADLFVTSGANLGDGLAEPGDLCPGDVYELDPDAAPLRLALARPDAAHHRPQVVAQGSEVGAPGDPVAFAARLVLMAPDGQQVELLVLRHGAGLYVLPLTPIAPRTEYTLLVAEDPPADLHLGDLICLSFHRGTRIALATGAQEAIENLTPGTRVLTRDHGPQPVRWIGRTTLRARGAFAPVVITRGVMGNEADLIVGPHHRLFLYQRDRLPGVGAAELLVQAQHLVDGESVFRREGGFAEYFSLVFDRHEIIYAEGIPVESLMVNEATVAALPAELAQEVRASLPGLSQRQHFGVEPDESQLGALRPQALRRRRPVRAT